MLKSLPSSLMHKLQALFSAEDRLTDPADCWVYGYDNSRRQSSPAAVVFVRTHEQVEALVKLANEFHIPLLAHGRGTATTGAAVPVHGGIVVSFEKMNRVISFEPGNQLMVVEPGISNQVVQDIAKKAGLFWAPDPSSAAFCSVGGNLACNAGGPHAIKYGTCRENTLGLRIVTGAGDSLYTGVHTTKGVVGYDLTRLIIGSEGMLALITQATLKLLPILPARRTFKVTFDSIESATNAIIHLMNQAVVPSAVEFMDSNALNLVRDYQPDLVHPKAHALLLIEIDGFESAMKEMMFQIKETCRVEGVLEIHIAQTEEERLNLWKVRKALSPLLRHVANKKINEDVVVPVMALSTFISKTHELSQQYKIHIVNFGHAGNGNIHVNLLFDSDDEKQVQAAELCLKDIFAFVLSLKGTLSGEHGIGLEKKEFVKDELSPAALKLMSHIKHCFDPQGILNPGKSIDPHS